MQSRTDVKRLWVVELNPAPTFRWQRRGGQLAGNYTKQLGQGDADRNDCLITSWRMTSTHVHVC
jgi:hypothetical protein